MIIPVRNFTDWSIKLGLVENGRAAAWELRYSSEDAARKESFRQPFHPIPHSAWYLCVPRPFTMIQSTKVPGGTYFRMFGVDPVAIAVGMVSEGALFFGVLLVFGTFWWFYIGWIGRKSWEGSVSRFSSALGAVPSLFSALTGVTITHSILSSDASALQVGAIVQYACIGLLCLGAMVAAIYSTIAVVQRNKTFGSRTI